MKVRISFEEVFLNIAYEWSKRSTCSSRIAVGAVIVNNRKQVIASGYNGAPRGLSHCNEVGCEFDEGQHCIRTIHAETNAIIQCAQNGISTIGTQVYVTHSPCYNCARLLIQAGIKKVIYKLPYKDIAKVESLFRSADVFIGQYISEAEWLDN